MMPTWLLTTLATIGALTTLCLAGVILMLAQECARVEREIKRRAAIRRVLDAGREPQT